MNCVVCKNKSEIIFNRKGYYYYQCSHCKTIFVPGGIDQSGMVGGGYEVERNTQQNTDRILRFIDLVGKYGTILDFGCGHGMLVNDCKNADLDCDGYDKFNYQLDRVPERLYNLISLVEVIEHTSHPFAEIDLIREKLFNKGIVYIETSFTDVAEQENIPIEDFFYIEPSVGHCTIFSHYGLDLLMQSKGFKVLPPINRNVRLYVKNK